MPADEVLSTGGGEMEVMIGEELMNRIRSIARREGTTVDEAVELCFRAGFDEARRSLASWEREARDLGLLERIQSLREMKYRMLAELMDLRACSVSVKHRGYEEFNAVTTALMSYLGKRAEAVRLRALLEERGTVVDLEPGMMPGIEGLASRYLFKVDREDGQEG